jgi:glucose-6-phosphate isomerase
MTTLKVHYHKALDFVSEAEIKSYQQGIEAANKALASKTGKGNDFLGWLDLPSKTEETLLSQIETTAAKIRNAVDVFVVIGIGGSYLGAKSIIDALSHHFAAALDKKTRKAPLIVYAGNNICADYIADLFDLLQGKEYAVAVISKSGTTTEPALAFRMFKQDLEKKHGKEGAKERIIAVTDPKSGALRQLAATEGYTTFTIPPDVGGRFSVLTAVGLLPIAVAGFDIRSLVNGAKAMENIGNGDASIANNPISRYVAVRNALYKKGKNIEILAAYHPRLQYIGEWWKQLYGESEGKGGKGIFPASVNFSCDLHSMGQLIQDGERNIFETVLAVAQTKHTVVVPNDPENLDKLNFLTGKTIQEVNKQAEKGTLIAHVEGGVPNIAIEIETINEYNLGQLIYFFEKACAVSGYQIDVNPFDQPGVEAYKTNMFALLGKAGFEQLAAEIKAKL